MNLISFEKSLDLLEKSKSKTTKQNNTNFYSLDYFVLYLLGIVNHFVICPNFYELFWILRWWFWSPPINMFSLAIEFLSSACFWMNFPLQDMQPSCTLFGGILSLVYSYFSRPNLVKLYSQGPTLSFHIHFTHTSSNTKQNLSIQKGSLTLNISEKLSWLD